MTEQKQKYISGKIRKLIDEGYKDSKQRIAIALEYARKKGYDVGTKKESTNGK